MCFKIINKQYFHLVLIKYAYIINFWLTFLFYFCCFFSLSQFSGWYSKLLKLHTTNVNKYGDIGKEYSYMIKLEWVLLRGHGLIDKILSW